MIVLVRIAAGKVIARHDLDSLADLAGNPAYLASLFDITARPDVADVAVGSTYAAGTDTFTNFPAVLSEREIIASAVGPLTQPQRDEALKFLLGKP